MRLMEEAQTHEDMNTWEEIREERGGLVGGMEEFQRATNLGSERIFDFTQRQSRYRRTWGDLQKKSRDEGGQAGREEKKGERGRGGSTTETG